MPRRRILKIGTALVAGAATLGGAAFLYQVRRPPVANSYYVALGSSFAAGLGLGPRAASSPVVSQRSVNGYPQQLARLLNVPSFTDMTSSGATIRHVLAGGQMLMGPQIAALGPDTRLVTLTAGGNDVSYIGDITAMAFRSRKGLVGAMVEAFWGGAKPVDERAFAALEDDFHRTMREIKRRSPHAQIVVTTYPVIIPATGTCARLALTEEEAKLMRAVGDKLAVITRTAARKANVIFVDIAALSAGHDACSAEPWVNGSRPDTGADFHPTLAGARATAEAIAGAIRGESAS